jgi:hypothetical protein
MYNLQTYWQYFSKFVTSWNTDCCTMFAFRERKREREVISELRVFLPKYFAVPILFLKIILRLYFLCYIEKQIIMQVKFCYGTLK